MFHCGATIHECLSNDRQTGIHYVGFVDVKDELWILNDINPETQWKTAWMKENTACYTSEANLGQFEIRHQYFCQMQMTCCFSTYGQHLGQ